MRKQIERGYGTGLINIWLQLLLHHTVSRAEAELSCLWVFPTALRRTLGSRRHLSSETDVHTVSAVLTFRAVPSGQAPVSGIQKAPESVVLSPSCPSVCSKEPATSLWNECAWGAGGHVLTCQATCWACNNGWGRASALQRVHRPKSSKVQRRRKEEGMGWTLRLGDWEMGIDIDTMILILCIK